MPHCVKYYKKMSDIGRKLQYFREKKGLNPRQLSKLCSVSPEWIYKVESGAIENVGLQKLQEIAKALDVKLTELLDFGSIMAGIGESETDDDDDFAGPEIPIVGFVNAGKSEICFDDMGFPTGRGIGSVQRPRELLNDHHAFAVVARGDSMSPRIDDGEVVVAAPTKQILPNKEAVIRLKNDEIYLKYVKEQSNMYILMSENSAYEPIIVKKSDIKFIYRVYVIYPGDYKRFLK